MPDHPSSPALPRLEMHGISKRFGATVALDGVSLRVYPGEVLALVGENGAGKSTLMKVLSGAHQPDAGQMLLDGRPFSPAHPLIARKAGVAMIYQELSLAPHLSVEDNIALGVEPHRWGWIDRRRVRATALKAIELFGHAEIDPAKKAGQLPVAAQQLVEIARALAVGCRVLVLDEPTSSLTQHDTEQLFQLIKQMKNQGLAIIYISHFLEEVKRVAGRITVLRDGKTVAECGVNEASISQIITWMVGREVTDLYPRSPRAAGETVLETADLAGFEKPLSASISLRRGEVVGIAGLMGAGRTELLRCLFGLDAVRHGRIKIGAFIGPASPARRWQQGVGLLSEDRKQEGLALSLSIADNATLSSLSGFGPAGLILPHRQAKSTQVWINRLGIRCLGPGQRTAELSGGNQQKVALARLLLQDVDVLLLDEPTRGIDVAAKAAIYRMIDELATGFEGRKPKALLVVSSYLPELLGICDRIAVMCRGRLGPLRPAREIGEHALMLEATGQERTN
ncbi:MAG: sugar ABC transporter ATP-binding protein [Candidatus Omnitrophica bacterium]|nr:sugar ABC transporter ATP-binding protein [Candidatus Omnitrophota bacterium]